MDINKTVTPEVQLSGSNKVGDDDSADRIADKGRSLSSARLRARTPSCVRPKTPSSTGPVAQRDARSLSGPSPSTQFRSRTPTANRPGSTAPQVRYKTPTPVRPNTPGRLQSATASLSSTAPLGAANRNKSVGRARPDSAQRCRHQTTQKPSRYFTANATPASPSVPATILRMVHQKTDTDLLIHKNSVEEIAWKNMQQMVKPSPESRVGALNNTSVQTATEFTSSSTIFSDDDNNENMLSIANISVDVSNITSDNENSPPPVNYNSIQSAFRPSGIDGLRCSHRSSMSNRKSVEFEG